MPKRKKVEESCEAREAGERIKDSIDCPKCGVSILLCDCPAITLCECGHEISLHRKSGACRGCKCEEFKTAEGTLSDHDRAMLAKDLLGLMRNLWADETEAAVRKGIQAERRRLAQYLRANASEVSHHEAAEALHDFAAGLERGDDRPSKRLRVHYVKDGREGGCNFCDRYPHSPVFVLQGPGPGSALRARICVTCASELNGAVRAMTKKEMRDAQLHQG